MIDEAHVLERVLSGFAPADDAFERLVYRRERKQRNRRISAGALALALIVLGTALFLRVSASDPIPADRPADRSDELGIFAPVAGRIVYRNDGIDLGYDRGLWAVDPAAPADDLEGPIVAPEVGSALVRFGPDAIPLGWSSEGTELLLMRPIDDELTGGGQIAAADLSILHADGSETPLPTDATLIAGATISPDGARVVFAGWSGAGDECCSLLGLYAIDVASGRVDVLLESGERPLDHPSAPTFSPDGTRIAYIDGTGDHSQSVWVMGADGSDPRKILANRTTRRGQVSGLEWSPAGDQIALGLRPYGIYTFAPDGSGFAQVIASGISPYWSPDGSRMTYAIPCARQLPEGCSSFEIAYRHELAGLAVAEADGSDARELGFGTSGPWHPTSGRS